MLIHTPFFFPRRDVDADRQRSRAASHDFIDHTNRKSQECCISAYDFLTRNAGLRVLGCFLSADGETKYSNYTGRTARDIG